jgi:hypothetical protein
MFWEQRPTIGRPFQGDSLWNAFPGLNTSAGVFSPFGRPKMSKLQRTAIRSPGLAFVSVTTDCIEAARTAGDGAQGGSNKFSPYQAGR